MKFVVIIPARGGSKRFPDKNIYPLNNKPLIAYSIDYAKKNDLDVYVTTDSESIAGIARKWGAGIIQRPAELAGDYVSTAETLQHATEYLIRNNVEFDYTILLQPTNPLRPDKLLTDAKKIIGTEEYDSLMTVSPLKINFGRIVNDCFVPQNFQYGQRSQDLETLYYVNGLLYVTKKEIILNGLIVGNKMYTMIIDHLYGTIDIDTVDDLKYAELVINSREE